MIAIMKNHKVKNWALAVFLFSLSVLLTACNPDTAGKSSSVENQKIAITALEPATEEPNTTAQIPDTGSQLVLEQGNSWTAGIPGFGENALSAFTGDYRIPGHKALVRLWLTREFIFYDRWAWRTSMTGYTVLQKAEDIGRVVAISLDDTLTLVILLPKGTELTLEEEDRLITSLIRGLSGFSSQNSRSISLPAMISY